MAHLSTDGTKNSEARLISAERERNTKAVAERKLTRTEWAEHQVEELLSAPLISEFIFRSPKHKVPTEKEVVDYLIIHKGEGILVSQKAQEDPEARSQARNEVWVRKQIVGATAQLCGAIRNPKDLPKWCEHPRRGRVEFPRLPHIFHGIALAETRYAVDLRPAASDLAREFMGVPLTYLALNDFLNLVVQLSTIPELLEYLAARRRLAPSVFYGIGDEKVLFETYLMMGGAFEDVKTHDDARRVISGNPVEVERALQRNAEYLYHSGLMEYVADTLSQRDPNYAKDLPAGVMAMFDPDGERRHYLLLKEILADLRLRERAELGKAFDEVSKGVAGQAQGMSFKAARLDHRDRVFLFVASRNWKKSSLHAAVRTLVGGALAHYRKKDCLVIIDRDEEHFDLALSHPDYTVRSEDEEAGRVYFGTLRESTVDITRL